MDSRFKEEFHKPEIKKRYMLCRNTRHRAPSSVFLYTFLLYTNYTPTHTTTHTHTNITHTTLTLFTNSRSDPDTITKTSSVKLKYRLPLHFVRRATPRLTRSPPPPAQSSSWLPSSTKTNPSFTALFSCSAISFCRWIEWYFSLVSYRPRSPR